MLANAKIASPLSRKAILVAVNISQWTARRIDREVTNEVNSSHGASSDAGRYNKLLIEKERLETISKLVGKARSLHYSMTRPWADDGPRILPNALYQKFADEFRQIKREFEIAADAFARDYPAFVQERKVKLNGMFRESDYPAASEIRSKFNLDITVLPFPDSADFRADLDDDTLADIKEALVQNNAKTLDNAMKYTATEIAEAVGHMATKLAEYGVKERTYFHDSLVDNVRKLATLLPAFNFNNDPAYDQLVARISSELCVEDAQKLRDDAKVRDTVRKSAEQIAKQVESLFG